MIVCAACPLVQPLEVKQYMKRATLKKRFYALLIDYVLMGILFFLTATIIPKHIMQNFNNATWLVFLFNFIFLSKDFTGQSPGKKIIRIKIVKKSDLTNPGIVLPFIRNLFLCLGIIEAAIILLDKNHERLGDKATRTIVVEAG